MGRIDATHRRFQEWLPQSRIRMLRVLSRIGRGKYDLPACWDTLAALEKANGLKLDDCLVAASDKLARKRYGITDEVLAGQHEMSGNKRQRLEAIVTGAGTTLDKVSRQGAPAAVIDLGKSPQWSRPKLIAGTPPPSRRATACGRSMRCTWGASSCRSN
jgi:hypothetical protein